MKKRVWNRVISLLMVAVMSVTIFAGTGITVAAETEVSSISLTIPSNLLLAGATYTASNYNISKVDLDTQNCTVTGIIWNYPNGDLLGENERLEQNTEYGVLITLGAAGERTFVTGPAVMVNGKNATINGVSEDRKELVIEWKFTPKAELVQTVALENVPVPVNGNEAKEYTGETSECTATGTWYQYDADTKDYVSMISTDTFKDGGNYRLDLVLGTKPGFFFDDSTSIQVTGTDGGSENLSLTSSDNGVEWYASIYYSRGTEISEVEFSVPEPIVGKNLNDPALNMVTVPAGSHYEVKGEWHDSGDSTAGVFTKGKIYHFEYTVFTDDGYYLGKTVDVYVNDDFDISFNDGGGKTKDLRYNKSLKTKISEVVLSDVQKAELGKKLRVGIFDLKVPADANYKAIGEWMYYDWDSKNNVSVTDANNTVVNGQKYTLCINLQADDGCEFAEKIILTIDGASRAERGSYESVVSEIEYSFLEQIRQIEVTGVVEPVVGEAPDYSKLQSADPAKYKITEKKWTEGTIWGTPVAQFENGGTYYLNVKVEALPGYEIAPNASWKMGTGSGSTYPYTSEDANLQAEYSFATLIPEIRISNHSTVKVGEEPNKYIEAPDGANYRVGGDWYVWDDEEEDYEPVTGVFEAEKTYRLGITVSALPGYRFNQDATAVYLDGVLKEDFTITTNNARGFVYYVAEDTKLIHKVELTIDKPTVGNHYSIAPVITLPAGANYHLAGYDSDWHEGSIDENVDFTGYFAEGGSYGADFTLIANEGYMFAEDLLVVVNGIALPKEAYSASSLKILYGAYFFNMTCEHVYDDASDNICNACGYDRTVDYGKSPNTGDRSQPIIWMLLFAVSGMAAVGVNRRRRRDR